MKKLAIYLTICIILGVNNVFAINTSAKSAVVIDGDTHEILYSKNENEVLTMASTTKIMTAIIAIENADLSKEVTVKSDYTGIEGSSMYLKVGEKLSFDELLHGLMLMSGNDAAIAIANETTGDYDEFIQLMNEKVTDLGLLNTSFANPNGLDEENHYTTAYELAKIAAYALENDYFLQIVSSEYYSSQTRTMKNHNKLLFMDENFVGVKTGFTKKSGRCLVSAYNIDGKKLIAVTLSAPSDWSDHTNMMEYAKNLYEKYNFYTKDEIYDIIKVMSGDKSETHVLVEENVNLYLTQNQKENLKIDVIADKINYAPIKKGEIYGKIVFSLGEKEIFQTNLLYSEDISLEYIEEMNLFENFIDFVKNLFY